MKYYENGSFFDSEYNVSIPIGAIEISDEVYVYLINGITSGKIIETDEFGDLVLVDPPAQPPTVPYSVTPKQARLALLGAGLLSIVESAIDAIEGIDGDIARVTWRYANEIRRDDHLLAQIATGLNLTGEQIDQLFITAATL